MLGILYNQILTLLTTTPGNLVYHLILAFSIAGAIPGALNLWPRGRLVEGRRMLLGLGLLLISQLCLIGFASIAAYFPTYNTWLPVLDRAITSAGLVLLIWLWVFPAPSRPADLASLLLGLMILVLVAFTVVWSSANPAGPAFNGSPPDLVWSGFTLVLAFGGGLLALRRHPPGYETAIAVFLLLFLGELAHLLLPLPESDYPGAMRLAQIAAYPLILMLPARFTTAGSVRSPGSSGNQMGIPTQVFENFVSLATKTSQLELSRAIAAAVAHSMPADLCLLFSPPDANRIISILGGYNLFSSEYLPVATFDGQLVPVVSEAIHQARPLHLPASGNIPDLHGLENILNLPLSGSLLTSPLTTPGGDVLMALVLLTPYSNHQWSAPDQNKLADIAVSLGELLNQARQVGGFEEQLDRTDRALNHLQSENQRLSEALQDLTRSSVSLPSDIELLQAELRGALEENATLQRALSDVDRKGPTSSPPDSRNRDRLDTVAEFAQDLRQPATSILGYTDLLLGGSLGALDEPQKKLIERLKANASRIDRLIDILIKTTLERVPPESPIRSQGMNGFLAGIVAQARPQLEERGQTLTLQIPASLPPASMVGDNLEKAIACLLNNAVLATPQGGEVAIHADLQEDEDGQAYILIQFVDRGGGISPNDQKSVFSPKVSAHRANIPGLGEEPSNMAAARSFIEIEGGRIWMECEPGRGCTYSLLLPVAQGALLLADPKESPS